MEQESHALLDAINRAIVQFRGNYSRWAAVHGISYNELLVLYTLREQGYCTQKQICDRYLLPRQTINHVIGVLHAGGLLPRRPGPGREKAYVLTDAGLDYARPFWDSLEVGEAAALRRLGSDKLRTLAALLQEYDRALQESLEHREGKQP